MIIPRKSIKDKNTSPSASPTPFIQSTRTTSIHNFNPSPAYALSTIHKRKKHWRSPSNPVDFHLNCELVSKEAGIKIEAEMMIPSSKLVQGSPCTSIQTTQKQLNFYNQTSKNREKISSKLGQYKSGNFKDFKLTPEMTVNVVKSSQFLNSYETMLLKKPIDSKFKMIAELSISPIVSTGSSDYTSTRRHVFTFDSSYCCADFSTDSSFDSTSLAHGHIDSMTSDSTTKKSVTFSRCSLLQVILRNPQDNSVAGIFVVKLELSDMPPDSKTILRQKAYKSKCLTDESAIDNASEYLAKFIEIPLKRSYDPEAKRQKIQLSGPIRVAFSFNRSNLRYTSPRKSDATAVEPTQKTRTILQFPCKDQKYFPLIDDKISLTNHDRLRSNSLTTENSTRSFQHGSLCL